jgi:hypothetical protein
VFAATTRSSSTARRTEAPHRREPRESCGCGPTDLAADFLPPSSHLAGRRSKGYRLSQATTAPYRRSETSTLSRRRLSLVLLACTLALGLAAPPARAQGLLNADEAKAIDKCQRAIDKGAASFVATKLKSLRSCFDALFRCIQRKPEDDACLQKAVRTCDKTLLRVAAQAAKLRAAIDRGCAQDAIPFASLITANGADLGELTAPCAAHGIAIDSLRHYEDCLLAHLECAAEEQMRVAAPRAAELLTAAGQEFPRAACVTPLPTATPSGGATPTPTTTLAPATATATGTTSPAVATPTVIATPTATPVLATPSVTPEVTGAATATPPTATATVTPTPTATPTAAASPLPFNLVFVTSTAHAANFGGLAGGDAICATRAAAAGLAGTFVAWLSDSGTNADTRLGTARGFVRVDGLPFADQVSDITGNKIWHAIRIDETGADAGAAEVWTGTLPNGSESVGGDCGDWTSTLGSGLDGSASGGPASWTNRQNVSCNGARRLYCFQIDETSALVPSVTGGKVAFVSLATFTPGGGLAAADAICASEGGAGYQALLATTTASAASRFTAAPTYVRPDGIAIASGATLFAGDILASGIWQRQSGVYLSSSSEIVWTGAATPGVLGSAASTCDDWTSTVSTTATIGAATLSDSQWWNFNSNGNCATPRHLYCVEE